MNIRSKVGATVLATACLLGLTLASYADDEKTAQAQPILADAQRAAPNFVGISNWLNSGPLTLADLRGKVVLVDFWTYGCINCTRTLPHVTRLYDTYQDRGLVVVGIHTPEFPFEKMATATSRPRSSAMASSIRSRKTTTMRRGTPTTISTGRRSTSSTRTERSSSSMPAKASTMRLNERSRSFLIIRANE